jgi:hypothetical protein
LTSVLKTFRQWQCSHQGHNTWKKNSFPEYCKFWLSEVSLEVEHEVGKMLWGRGNILVSVSSVLKSLVPCYLLLFCFTSFSGHFVAPFAAHAFCNHMGFPEFGEILTYKDPQRMLLMSLFVFGLVAWCILLTPLTNPAWYSNHLFWKNHWYMGVISYDSAQYY